MGKITAAVHQNSRHPLQNTPLLFFSVDQACRCVCWSPPSIKESACVAAGYSNGTLRIFRLASSEMEMKLHPHHVAVTAIQYSANGERGQQFLKLPSSVFTVIVKTPLCLSLPCLRVLLIVSCVLTPSRE